MANVANTEIKVYIYIPKDVLASVEKRGYFSARKLYEVLGIETTKYRERRKQFETKFCMTFPGRNDMEKDLAHRDAHHRRYKRPNGSNLLFAFFYPVPNDILKITETKRKSTYRNIEDAELFEFTLPASSPHWQLELCGRDPITPENAGNREFWVNLWNEELKHGESKTNRGYYNIPHLAFHIDECSGWINFKDLTPLDKYSY